MKDMDDHSSDTKELHALKIDVEPKRLLITSEPYVVYTARGYQAVVDVFERKTRKQFFLYLGAASLSRALEQLRRDNSDAFVGLEFWLRKADSARMSPYVLEE